MFAFVTIAPQNNYSTTLMCLPVKVSNFFATVSTMSIIILPGPLGTNPLQRVP